MKARLNAINQRFPTWGTQDVHIVHHLVFYIKNLVPLGFNNTLGVRELHFFFFFLPPASVFKKFGNRWCRLLEIWLADYTAIAESVLEDEYVEVK